MTAINYLRKIEKEITEKANKNYQSVDGRRIHEITRTTYENIITNNDNLKTRKLNGEIIISTYHTYYQIYIKIVDNSEKVNTDKAIKALQKKLGSMLLPI